VPFVVIATEFALENVLPLTVKGVVPQVLPLILLSVREGPFTHPHDTEKLVPAVVHPEALRTVIVWLPFATLLNVTLVWYGPLSKRYSIPTPVGLVTVTVAFPDPSEQSVVCEGVAGAVLGAAVPDPAALVQPLRV
jgi:hypothetical protein